jgi:ribonuclease VapC
VILDTSAVLAVVFREPGFEILLDKIVASQNLAIGAPTLTEAGIVLGSRLGKDARGLLLQLLHEWQVTVIPFGERHWQEAIAAYSRFGRGKHKAALNFGDCLSYAVAKLSDQPLLCTGKDFGNTDIRVG